MTDFASALHGSGSSQSSAGLIDFASSLRNPSPPQPSSSPVSTPQPVVSAQPNLFQKVSQEANDFITNTSKTVNNLFSNVGNFVKSNIIDNPTVKNVSNSLNQSIGTGPMKGKTDNLGYTFTGNTIKDVANVILENLPALGLMGGGDVVQGFSKTKALITAATQAGVQIAAGVQPSEVLKSLPFGLAGGAEFRNSILPKINGIKEDAFNQAKDNFPAIFTPEEAKTEVVGSNLANTPLGKEILKTAFSSDRNQNNIHIVPDANSNLETPAGIAVRIESVSGKSTVIRNVNDLIAHEDAPDTQTIEQYKQAITAGEKPALVVTQEGNKWGVEDGKHKLEAYKQLGINDVPTIEKQASPIEQQLQFSKAIRTPDDAALNPIIDNLSDIIKSNEEYSTQNQTSPITQSSDGSAPQDFQDLTSPKFNSQSQSNIEGIKGSVGEFSEGSKSVNTQNGLTEESRSARIGESVKPDNTARYGQGISKLTSDIAKRLGTDFTDLPGYEKMNMADQKSRAIDLILTDPKQAKDIAMGVKSSPSDLQEGMVFKAVAAKADLEGDIQTLRDLARTDLAGKAGQALKAYDAFNPDDPVSAIKQLIDARTKDIESKYGKSIDQIQKDNIKTIETEVKKAISKGASGSKNKLANFIKAIQC